MNGIERSKNFFYSRVLPMLEEDFSGMIPKIAAGIAGRGSECFGFDDEISLDHDCGTGVSLWLNDEDEEKYGFKLMRAYDQLHKNSFPEEISGSRLGYQEHGVCRISDFYRRHLGFPHAPECWQQWFYTPEYSFAESVNGEVFTDIPGEFSHIRRKINEGMPEDVWKKKTAACSIMMAQSGQYNFERCLKHGEKGAAMFALTEFVRHALRMIYLLNNKFPPYYKWQFRGARELALFNGWVDPLEKLLTGQSVPEEKLTVIEGFCSQVIREFARRGLSGNKDNYLEPHAFEIYHSISLRELREIHIMEG